MKKSVLEATEAEILFDISSYEDPDSVLSISPTEDGKIWVTDAEWKKSGTGDTLKEALLDYARNSNYNYAREDERDYYRLEWKDLYESTSDTRTME